MLKYDRIADGGTKIRKPGLDDLTCIHHTLGKRQRKAVAAVADLIASQFMDVGICQDRLDRIAINDDLDGKPPSEVTDIHNISAKTPLTRARKVRAQHTTYCHMQVTKPTGQAQP
jgi:hypothetical protein